MSPRSNVERRYHDKIGWKRSKTPLNSYSNHANAVLNASFRSLINASSVLYPSRSNKSTAILLPCDFGPIFNRDMRKKIVLFGDSITEEAFRDGGWAADLAGHFSRSADIVLRGYSGYNTRWALKIMEKAMEGVVTAGEVPLAVTVFFGANDASLEERSSGFQHVPIGEYKENLKSMCSILKEWWPSTLVVLITPPPIDEDGRIKNPYGDNTSGLSERTNESAGAYAQACISVAKDNGIPVINIWSKMQQFRGWEKSFLRDGLHFTAGGNRVLFEEILDCFRKALSLESLPIDQPLFSDIDPIDPLKAFM